MKSCRSEILTRSYPIISALNYDLIVGYRTGKPRNRGMNKSSAFRSIHTPTNIIERQPVTTGILPPDSSMHVSPIMITEKEEEGNFTETIMHRENSCKRRT